jgi:large subunit ribosomal protein L6
MSRIGKQPVVLPKGVTVALTGGVVAVKGPKGELEKPLNELVTASLVDSKVQFARKDDSRQARAASGLMRALTQNMVVGVTRGFQRDLEINGVGYRAEVKGKQLVMQLGYSHPIEYDLPQGVTAKVEKNLVSLTAIDKELLGQTAAKVRSFRPPEPYKGKGIKYVEERIQRKVGKAGATA